jgi:hypothetical protein
MPSLPEESEDAAESLGARLLNETRPRILAVLDALQAWEAVPLGQRKNLRDQCEAAIMQQLSVAVTGVRPVLQALGVVASALAIVLIRNAVTLRRFDKTSRTPPPSVLSSDREAVILEPRQDAVERRPRDASCGVKLRNRMALASAERLINWLRCPSERRPAKGFAVP